MGYEMRKNMSNSSSSSSSSTSTTKAASTSTEDSYKYDDDSEDYNKFIAANVAAVNAAASDDDTTTTKTKTPAESQQQLCQMVLPGDCSPTSRSQIAFGGFVMKLMDNAAGCCAYRHCRTNVVTVSISAMDLTNFIRLGDVVTIDAKLLFCSSKSMEISITATSASITRIDEN